MHNPVYSSSQAQNPDSRQIKARIFLIMIAIVNQFIYIFQFRIEIWNIGIFIYLWLIIYLLGSMLEIIDIAFSGRI